MFSSFWNDLYSRSQTAWDIGHVSPPLQAYIDQLERKDCRILIPGAGRSYEAIYLSQQGFTDITVADIASVVTDELQKQLGDGHPAIRVLHADFFMLSPAYDLILEQTFFCALPPAQRPAYVAKMNELLAGSGTLAGVLFNREFEEHPPYGGSIAEYRQLFSPVMRIKTLEECYNSIPPRAGSELFLIAKAV